MPTLARADGETLAYTKLEPAANRPTLVWLSGFKSDMSGGKAIAVKDFAEGEGLGYLAFDYLGHGESSGDFADGTISRWREDCLAAVDELSQGPLLLIGSSMGGWMSLLTAKARKERIAGMVLIAPAPDFTSKLMWPELSETARQEISEKGVWMRPTPYGEPYPLTRRLFEDGAQWSVLDEPIDLSVPVTILQGKVDPDVPWTHALKVQDALASADVEFVLIKDGEHRLSRDQDIERLLMEIKRLVRKIG
ncbi:alpha/beta hydrolase [Ponticaulis sp.]|uniref:alpha/beta hydrolase n=1 Tax=Ponticaulis sp. TaxID=2020902 RepID=UPI000C9753F1|nr:alpha/beta hydrolase [Ponticaulis sp.]MAI90142.1 alpha/beta hydrolase [Ponticaulis sp.]|tara:strand:+ start:103607 stop:104356 length:750 start_codon:yes stop_codon:yes gene_type:complete